MQATIAPAVSCPSSIRRSAVQPKDGSAPNHYYLDPRQGSSRQHVPHSEDQLNSRTQRVPSLTDVSHGAQSTQQNDWVTYLCNELRRRPHNVREHDGVAVVARASHARRDAVMTVEGLPCSNMCGVLAHPSSCLGVACVQKQVYLLLCRRGVQASMVWLHSAPYLREIQT